MNGRECDALGRPLPPGVPGLPGPPSRRDRSPDETLREAQRWLDEGRPFAAHEIFEDAWKSCPAAERDLWQGLAQTSVALTHALRGNPAGAEALLTRAGENLRPYAATPPYDIDIAAVLGWLDELGTALAAGPPAEKLVIPPMPPLRASGQRL